MAGSKEKRRAKRVPLQIKVDYQYEGNFLFEYASDISQHGIFIESKEPLPPGSEVALQFTLPETNDAIEVAGEVIWINDNKDGGKTPGMGIKFSHLKQLDKELLTSLIRRLAVL